MKWELAKSPQRSEAAPKASCVTPPTLRHARAGWDRACLRPATTGTFQLRASIVGLNHREPRKDM